MEVNTASTFGCSQPFPGKPLRRPCCAMCMHCIARTCCFMHLQRGQLLDKLSDLVEFVSSGASHSAAWHHCVCRGRAARPGVVACCVAVSRRTALMKVVGRAQHSMLGGDGGRGGHSVACPVPERPCSRCLALRVLGRVVVCRAVLSCGGRPSRRYATHRARAAGVCGRPAPRQRPHPRRRVPILLSALLRVVRGRGNGGCATAVPCCSASRRADLCCTVSCEDEYRNGPEVERI